MNKRRKRSHNKSTIFFAVLLLFLIVVSLKLSLNKTSLGGDIPKNQYDYSGFVDSDYLIYADEQYESMLGLDVSELQGYIDWDKVKDAGIEFAYIRIAYRGATYGYMYQDDRFAFNYDEAKRVGLKVGVYLYSQAIDEPEAREEAAYLLKILGDRQLDLPIVYDYEITENVSYCRVEGLSMSQKTRNCLAFIDWIKKDHHDVMIYTNLDWAYNHYDLNTISEYDLWLAEWNPYPSFEYAFKVWQFTDKGIVDGIITPVDLDLMFIKRNYDQHE